MGHPNALNEDSVCTERLADGTWLFAVADGIGGYEGGEVASALGVATLTEAVAGQAGPLDERLRLAAAEANRRIIDLQQTGRPELRAMGTTLTAMAVDEQGRAAVVHIGDSRLYRLDGDRLVQLTRDHNVVGELVREGLLEEEERVDHPQRHMLTRALGVGEDADADVFELTLRDGDAFLLLTDGMVDAIGEVEAARLLREHAGNWQAVGPALAALARERQNVDDATAVAVRVQAVEAGS